MAQFDGGKYSKSGVLSYNYLGGKGGKGKGGVSIKKIRGDWHFVDKKGEIRTNVGIKGKLTPTHMQNLEDDGIFAAAKIKPDGTKLSTAEIKVAKAKIKAGPEGGYSSNAGDSVSIDSSGNVTDGSASVQPDLTERGNLRVAPQGRDGELTTSNFNDGRSEIRSDVSNSSLSGSSANSPVVANPSSGYGEYTYPGGEGPVTSNFGGGRKMGIGDNTGIGDNYSLPSSTPKQSSYGGNEWQDKNPRGYGSFNPDGPGYRYTKEGAVVEPYASESSMTVAPGNNNMIPASSASGWSDMSNAGPPGVEIQSTGFGGRPETPVGGNVFNTAQDSTTPGITDKKDGGWGAADWNAAGSVMKGVGGLYGAWTGMKNYQLARDAHNAQKDQWQANYNQQLAAYKDNKAMANQEIDARNRTLAARGQGTATGEGALIKHI